MKVDISMYEALRKVAKGHKIKNRAWSKAADIPEPRISELNRILLSGPLTGRKARQCSLEKILPLYHGLVKILGAGQVKKDLESLLDGEKDITKRLIIMCLILGEAGEEYRNQAEMFLQTLLRSISNNK